jgi:putative addiction module component (TIGR02574 family)
MARPPLNLHELSRDERLELIDGIWESLHADFPDDPLILPSQLRELERRLDEMDRDGATGISWEEARKEIESQVKERTEKE